MLDCPEVGRGGGVSSWSEGTSGNGFFFFHIIIINMIMFPWVRQSGGLVLDPTNGLHLVGVSLGAVLIVVSVLALVSVSLQDILVATVTRELIGHPAAGGKWEGKKKKTGGVRQAQTGDVTRNSAILLRELDMNARSAKPSGRWDAYAPELTLIEGTSLLHQPMACSEG